MPHQMFKQIEEDISIRDQTLNWILIKPKVESFPSENEEILPGLKWGHYGKLYTPAFWKVQYLLSSQHQKNFSHKLCNTLVEEIVMCILGGYGIPSEMGVTAFKKLQEEKLIKSNITFEKLYRVLASPFKVKNDKYVRYRFYNQKAKYVHSFLNRVDLKTISQLNDLELREWLLTVQGIGLKTASWITRNWLHSNRVAILDIHVLRAGKLTGFFENLNISNYRILEKKYLEFCDAIKVNAADMDAIIWGYMKKNNKLNSKILYS